MERYVVKLSEAVGSCVRMLALVSGLLLMALMMLTVAAVSLRKANNPIFGAQDISESGLIAVVFFAMAYSGWTGGHIAVDLIGNVIKGRALQLLDVGVRLVCALFFIVVTWMTVIHGLDALEFGDEFNLLPIPHWPFYFVIAFGSGVFTFVLFLLAARSACGLPEIKVK
ncbi:MAG: TRAP-type C4-dicarboxylate transport system permease small subunit [Paracoccaceae bacterium]|jgi:TRAP-type C4-dicarboxylate transport system permease small subunit